MNLNLIDKISYFKNYVIDVINSKIISYNKIIENGRKNNNFRFMMNLYNIGICNNSCFDEKKVVLKYYGKRKFIIGLLTSSYWNINDVVSNICENFNCENKIKPKFPNFIENVYLIDQEENNINIIDELNECIDYNNNMITFKEIAELHDFKNISCVKIEYVKTFKKYTKNIEFIEYENKDVSILNNIFDENV
jgi:hypothetical protein